jgi:hypothetical protein
LKDLPLKNVWHWEVLWLRSPFIFPFLRSFYIEEMHQGLICVDWIILLWYLVFQIKWVVPTAPTQPVAVMGGFPCNACKQSVGVWEYSFLKVDFYTDSTYGVKYNCRKRMLEDWLISWIKMPSLCSAE